MNTLGLCRDGLVSEPAWSPAENSLVPCPHAAYPRHTGCWCKVEHAPLPGVAGGVVVLRPEYPHLPATDKRSLPHLMRVEAGGVVWKGWFPTRADALERLREHLLSFAKTKPIVRVSPHPELGWGGYVMTYQEHTVSRQISTEPRNSEASFFGALAVVLRGLGRPCHVRVSCSREHGNALSVGSVCRSGRVQTLEAASRHIVILDEKEKGPGANPGALVCSGTGETIR